MKLITEITTKELSVELFRQGFFGNRVQQWNTFTELQESPYNGLVAIRQKTRQYGGRGITIYDVRKQDVRTTLFRLKRQGIAKKTLYFNEAIKPADVIFQGEIMRMDNGLYLLYSILPAHMHDALAVKPEHAWGLRVRLLLEYYLCLQGLMCVMELLERFTDHVVEFTCCSRGFGNLGWRTVVWECRKF